MISILSWNVNGLRSIIKKNNIIDDSHVLNNTFENFISNLNPDIIVLTETKLNKCSDNLFDSLLSQYKYRYIQPCNVHKGRNGVIIFSKIKPLNVLFNITDEGRYIQLEFSNVYVCGVYVPNSGDKLKRLDYRINTWNPLFLNHVNNLKKIKDVIICGDLNVINNINDTSNYKGQINKIAGVTQLEINNFHLLLNSGFIDVYNYLFPNKVEFTYYSYYTHGRKYNKGMRIDYFLVTKNILKNIITMNVLNNIYGSDHLPILLTLKKL